MVEKDDFRGMKAADLIGEALFFDNKHCFSWTGTQPKHYFSQPNTAFCGRKYYFLTTNNITSGQREHAIATVCAHIRN